MAVHHLVEPPSLAGTYSVSPAYAATLPGQPNPFQLYLDQVYEIVDYEVAVSTWSRYSSNVYGPVTIVSKNILGVCDFITVTGEIRNDQPYALESIVVLVEYAAAGPEGPRFQPAELGEESLAPGETTSYMVEILSAHNCLTADAFHISGQGVVAH